MCHPGMAPSHVYGVHFDFLAFLLLPFFLLPLFLPSLPFARRSSLSFRLSVSLSILSFVFFFSPSLSRSLSLTDLFVLCLFSSFSVLFASYLISIASSDPSPSFGNSLHPRLNCKQTLSTIGPLPSRSPPSDPASHSRPSYLLLLSTLLALALFFCLARTEENVSLHHPPCYFIILALPSLPFRLGPAPSSSHPRILTLSDASHLQPPGANDSNQVRFHRVSIHPSHHTPFCPSCIRTLSWL